MTMAPSDTLVAKLLLRDPRDEAPLHESSQTPRRPILRVNQGVHRVSESSLRSTVPAPGVAPRIRRDDWINRPRISPASASNLTRRARPATIDQPNPVRKWYVSMRESILSLSEFKADASRLLDQIRDEPTRIVLTQNGRARAVVEDYAAYQRREQALVMLRLMAQGEADARAGRLTDQGNVFAALRERLQGTSSSGD
jgi:prevent-host-death family protein